MMTKYKPQSTNARPWDEIEEHYVDLNRHGWGHDNLLALVKHIKASGLRDRLFAYTSMDKLVVSIYDPIEWNREALHIEFSQAVQQWHFSYYAIPNARPEVERRYNANLGIVKFDKFLSILKW